MHDPDEQPHEDAAAASPARRPVRSFVLRGGRLGPGQQRALDALGPRFVLPLRDAPLDAEALFGRRAPLVVEIGFGMGDATARIAQAQPQCDFIGIEVHEAGVGALLKRIGELELSNLRIVRDDAVEVLRRMIAPGSLAGVHLYFPDPWPKKRHWKRRIVQPAFAALVASRLAPGGYWHCATDWRPYAEQMLEVLGAEPALRNRATSAAGAGVGAGADAAAGGGYSPRPPWRPLTKFEQRGMALGHGVWDLLFERAG